ncbi:putative emp24/gp25L/p24 family/GOLD [Monocercomonoides exilis]|uniref:putative emp24/gp25L/p24 family/GOLD n=1 Tax=Monocercomonoides exilis TaxID=2049356 RepID=UPI00355AAE75|nr:putative emp24/gp25L/p24 family/GOLD [Monocercomonoides exilis]
MRFLCFVYLSYIISCIVIDVNHADLRCFSEYLLNDQIVKVKISQFSKSDGNFDFSILGPENKYILGRYNVTFGSWTFTTKKVGDYTFCVSESSSYRAQNNITSTNPIRINISIKHGAEAMLFEKREQYEGSYISLIENANGLNIVTQEVYDQIKQIKGKQQTTFNASVKNLRRIRSFSISSICIIIALSIIEIMYLRNLFIQQKVA